VEWQEGGHWAVEMRGEMGGSGALGC